MMQTDAGTLSFGPYLKAIREQQNIPLSAVASEIRVGLWQLTLIEAEAHDQLPDTIYVKGILKAYAACIGVDTNDILERYSINRRAYEQASVSEDKKNRPAGNNIVRIVIVLCLLLAGSALFALLFYFSAVRTGPPRGIPALSEPGLSQAGPDMPPVTSMGNPAEKSDKSVTAPVVDVVKPAGQTSRLDLFIDAVSETTINIQVDGMVSKKLYLSAKDHVEMAASSSFNILISDSAAVNLTLNGKQVAFEKVPGRSVNLVLSVKGRN